MRLTTQALNRATLERQGLLRRESIGLDDALRRVVALQAQEAASPYISLWNRIADFDPTDLDAAFNHGDVVKATLMRITLHAVHANDYQSFREAMEPSIRASRLGDRRFLASGLAIEDADALVPEIVAHAGQPRTADEMSNWLGERIDAAQHRGAWWGLRQYAPLLRAPTGGPWSFNARMAYLAPRTMPVLADQDVSARSLQTLVLRYLEGFGPASVADIAQFALVQRARVKRALQALANDLEPLEGPNGEGLFDIAGASRPDENTPSPPRLLAMWDNVLLAYHDRSRIIPLAYRKLVTRSNGDVLPTLLVDGYVAGVWRPVESGIEATAFHDLPEDAWDGLAAEAGSLVRFLADRDPDVYRRYTHWWSKLPDADVRLIATR